MLRDLSALNSNGSGILGTHLVGVLASELPTGFALPGLLNNDVDAADPPGCLYRVEITSLPSAGALLVEENGAFAFTGAPDGTYTGTEKVYKNGVPVAGNYSLTVGSGQVITPPTDTTAPTVTAVAVANATPTVVALTASEALDSANVPAAAAFTVTGHTVQSVAVTGSTVKLTVTPAFVYGEAARTVAYTQPATGGARDAAGNLLATFAARAITNNVAAPVSSVSGVTVSPATVTIAGNGAQQFVATVLGNGSPSQAVTWTRSPALGTLTGAGGFVAPPATDTAQIITITATSQQDQNYAGSATVTVPAIADGGGFTRSITRTIKIKAAPLTFSGSAFWNLANPRRPVGSIDRDATIDISFDWTEVLADIGDTLNTVHFDVAGVTSLGGYSANGIATVFLTAPSGNSVGITCRIETNSIPARIEDRTVYLTVEDQ